MVGHTAQQVMSRSGLEKTEGVSDTWSPGRGRCRVLAPMLPCGRGAWLVQLLPVLGASQNRASAGGNGRVPGV